MSELAVQQLKEIPMEIDYDSIQIISEWKYNCENIYCGVCDSSLYEPPNAKQNLNQNNININIVKGECSHAFHRSCLNKKLKRNTVCQLCPPGLNNHFVFKQNLENVSVIKLFKN